MNVTAVQLNATVGIGISAGQVDMTWVISEPAVEVCGVAMVVAILLSMIDTYHHVATWEHPKLQSGTVRILFMVPLYAFLSWLILLHPSWQFFLRTVRDTYEAFVLYQFLALLVEYCGGEAQLVQSLERKRHKGIHPFPMCFLPLFPLDRSFYVRCKRMVLQYAILKPIMALTALIAQPLGWYDETNFNWGSNLYPWLFLVYNVSISYSLWYLILFDFETHRELDYCKPLLKFVCIKAIIFFSYWQSAALSVLLNMGILYTGSTLDQQAIISGCIQEFLICIELVPIAILHHFGFGVTKLEEEMDEQPLYESAENVRRSESKLKRLDEALSLGQFVKDTASAVFTKAGQLTHGIATGRRSGQPTEGEEREGATGDTATKQGHPLFSKVAWPAPLMIPIGPGGMANHPTEAGVSLCAAVAMSRGVAQASDANDAPLGDHGAPPSAVHRPNPNDDGGDDSTAGDSDDDDTDEDVDDERQQERASRDASSFGLRIDDFDFIVKGAKSINRVVNKVLFDDYSGPQVGDFCVVCGRNDRQMIQRKSGLKCRECLGVKHNYNIHTV